MPLRLLAPGWGRLPTLVLACVCALALPAAAQPKGKPPAAKPDPKPADKPDKGDKGDKGATKKVQNFDFNAIKLNGSSRTPQLLYFLERANEELERSFLEKRSFIPHLVRSVDEEAL